MLAQYLSQFMATMPRGCGVVRMANSAIMAKSKENKTPLVNRVKKAMEEAQAKRHSVMTFILPDLGDNTTYVSPREAMRKNRVAQMQGPGG